MPRTHHQSNATALSQERALAAREVHGARIWSPQAIPPLLQTCDYARCVLRARGIPQEKVEQVVDARMVRVSQVAVHRREPVRYQVVLTRHGYEQRPPGATEKTMARQWGQLFDLGCLAHVHLRVLPTHLYRQGLGGLAGFTLYPNGSAHTVGPQGPHEPLEPPGVVAERFTHLWENALPYPG